MTDKISAKDKKHVASAFHVQSEDGQSIVGFGNLRVVLIPEDNGWFAQGLELDYLAEGETPKEAQNNFEEGLRMTICLNLQKFGTIEKMLKAAPPEVWKETGLHQGAKMKRINQVSVFDVVDGNTGEDSLPFRCVDYYVPESALLELNA